MNTTSALGHTNVSAISFFLIFLAISFGITAWAARRTRSTEDFYAAGRSLTAGQNGLALAGDFIAAAGFLGITGFISMAGYDGVIFSVGGVVGWPIMTFLLAEPLRNLGKYTFADVIAFRLGSERIRVYAGICGLVTVFMFLIIQLVGAGSLVERLFGIPYYLSVILVGLVMLAYVLGGGMIAATWVQIVKCILMIGTVIVLTGLVLAQFHFSPAAVFQAAAAKQGAKVLMPGGGLSAIELLSIGATTAFGVASFPQVLIRFYTVPDARTARMSLLYATYLVGINLLGAMILGFGAMALIGSDVIRGIERGGNMAVPLLAEYFGGTPFLGFVAAVAFATLLASVTGILIAGAATLSHDLWTGVIRSGRADEREQMRVARVSTVVLATAGILAAILLQGQNLGVLTTIASALPASTVFPPLVLAIYWKKLTPAGAIAGMMAGLFSAIAILWASPLVQVDVLHHASAYISLRTPGLFSMPIAFVASIVVSLMRVQTVDDKQYDVFERRMVLGAQEPGGTA